MIEKTYTGYDKSSILEKEIIDLDNSIDNIGNDNIINSSRIADIENDIQRIENNIKITNRKNKLRTCIRNLKIFGRALQGVLPYVVCASLAFTVQTLLGDVPFYPQDVFKIAQHEQVIDSEGILSDNIIYVRPSSKPYNSAHYSTKWEKKEDGKYYRVIKEYNIKDYTTEELKEFVKNPDFDFESIFGEKTSIKYEVKTEDQITEEDLNDRTSFKIVYRYNDEEDVVLKAQDIGMNIAGTLLYLLLTAVPSVCVWAWRDEYSYYDFNDYVDDYIRTYQKVDIEELERLFKEKKIKFEKVRHEKIDLIDNASAPTLSIKLGGIKK